MTPPHSRTMGVSAFEAVLDATSAAVEASPRVARRATVSVGITLDAEILDRARNAVFWTPGLTLTSIANQGFAVVLDELERDRGEPFPARTGRVRSGRPVRSRAWEDDGSLRDAHGEA